MLERNINSMTLCEEGGQLQNDKVTRGKGTWGTQNMMLGGQMGTAPGSLLCLVPLSVSLSMCVCMLPSIVPFLFWSFLEARDDRHLAGSYETHAQENRTLETIGERWRGS